MIFGAMIRTKFYSDFRLQDSVYSKITIDYINQYSKLKRKNYPSLTQLYI